MQPPGPPRPFRGAQYDKDMFTFLPAQLKRDVLVESPRKRKLTSSDHQIIAPAPNLMHGVSGISDSKSSTPVLGPRESSQGYSDHSQYWDQSDYAAKRRLQSPNHKAPSPSFSLPEGCTHKTLKLPPSGTGNFNQHNNCEPNLNLASNKGSNWSPVVTEAFSQHQNHAQVTTPITLDWQPPIVRDSYQHEIRESNAIVVTQNTSNWQHGNYEPNAHAATHKKSSGPPSESQNLNHYNNCESDAHVARESIVIHPQEIFSYAHQTPLKPRAMASDLHEQASKISGESQRLPQTVFEPGAVGLDVKGRCEEETYKVNCPNNVKEYRDAGGFSGLDSAEAYKVGSFSNVKQSETDNNKASGNNVSTSVYNLQNETNNLLNVLKLLSAASGVGLPDNNDGNVQGSGNDVKIMKSPSGSTIQNQNHLSADTNLSKNPDDAPALKNPAANVKLACAYLDSKSKSENGPSAFAEKLWDGTVKLSTSVSVSVIAFFKSGEKMQDFSWSEFVEVRGKVRLEAFEKYVQDLPRSRSRGLMVMSLCCKEGSSDAGHKGMKEVAKKYKEGKRVGFAKLSTDVDLYICPHSDAIITILAKHGFFKGMAAIKDKSDPLIGCAVWKKNSSAPATKTVEGNAPPSGQTSKEVATSEKSQNLIEVVQNGRRDKSPELLPSPQVNQTKQSIVTENLTSVSGTSSKLSEFKTDVEPNNPIPPIPPVSSKQPANNSDDDDLPEFDFRATVSQASVNNTSAVAAPTSSELKSECSTASVPVPDSQFQQCVEKYSEVPNQSFPPTQEHNHIGHFQGPAPQNMGQQHFLYQGLAPQHVNQYPEAHKPSFPTQDQNQTGQLQGSAPLNMGQQSEMKIPSLSVQEQKPMEKGAAGSKPRNLFDNEDMPEWCPPDFLKKREEANKKTGSSFSHSKPKVAGSGFANLTSGCTNGFSYDSSTAKSSQMQFKERDYCSTPHVPPPPPVGISATNNFMHHIPAAPTTQMQFRDKNPAAISSQMHFNERECRSAPHAPPPPPIGNPATNNLMHHSPAAPLSQMHFRDNNPSALSSQTQFNEREYLAPRVPPPPVNNPYQAANNFVHHNPVARSTQMQFGDANFSPAPRPPPYIDKPTNNGATHQNPAFPPGFAPSPAFRPCFDQP
uniref:Spen paralogue and orthologue SPOC C-terminal domain-containing protein n=1 Tax=Chenopodium quinoa TaxID=63459 RepID=A0A803LH56_CHEQI